MVANRSSNGRRWTRAWAAAAAVAALAGVATADQQLFTLQQPGAKEPPALTNLRPIEWGQLNFISTTDTHGWLAGHILESNYAADWGDYTSYLEHIRAIADEKGVDVIVVDSGDQHDGNGLSDATYPNGDLSQKILMMAPIDLMSIGNHELYKCEVTQQTYDVLAPHYGDRYITSNVDIMLPNGTWASIGSRYYQFTTKNQGFNVMTFGFLFDFKLNCNNSRVTPVEDVVKAPWFQSALLTPNIDIFVVFGHFPIRFWPEMWAVHRAIRAVHRTIPIQFFGGHSHVRDFSVLDGRATALQAGRFLETTGWVSINGLTHSADLVEEPGWAPPLNYSRRYLDFNTRSLSVHTNTTLGPDGTFSTPKGRAISEKIAEYRQRLNLTHVLGCVPHDYLLEKAEYPGEGSLLTLLEENVLKQLVPFETERKTNSRLIFINSGSLRFDMYGGQFTVDSGYIVSPFSNQWLYIPDMDYRVARAILAQLNDLDYILGLELATSVSRTLKVRAQNLGADFDRKVYETVRAQQIAYNPDDELLTTGYLTIDDKGMDGDDTPHKPNPLYYLPNAIAAEDNFPKWTDPALVDVVFLDFMKPFILDALKKIDPKTPAESWTVDNYGGKTVKLMLQDYVENNWGTDCFDKP
ncbi:Metallo-dependent phosphatase-like protein [Dipodascopsis tothii]|uniref:Metallo-dependent phosphatase-like protein n=1 Tax=Dipodascopsis tothii TaxID=44089 RepID=UPI0034CFB981